MQSLDSKYELYKNDCSNDEFIEALDEELNFKGHFIFCSDYSYCADKFENRMFQGFINEYFYKGSKEPFKKLASELGNFIKNKEMGLKFLCWLYGNLSELRAEFMDKLPEKNRVHFKSMDEFNIDFDTILNFYRGLKLNDYSFEKIKEIRKIVYWFIEADENIFNDCLNALENKKHAFDNEFLRLLYACFKPALTSNLFYCNPSHEDKRKKRKGDIIIKSCLNKDQKIDFEFWLMAKEIFNPGPKGIKELMKHFDNKMSLDTFYRYYMYFLEPNITPKDQVKQIINNLKIKPIVNNRENVIKASNNVYCRNIITAEKYLKRYNDQELIKNLKSKSKDKILDCLFSIENSEVREVLFDTELVSNKKFKAILKKLMIEFKQCVEERKKRSKSKI